MITFNFYHRDDTKKQMLKIKFSWETLEGTSPANWRILAEEGPKLRTTNTSPPITNGIPQIIARAGDTPAEYIVDDSIDLLRYLPTIKGTRSGAHRLETTNEDIYNFLYIMNYIKYLLINHSCAVFFDKDGEIMDLRHLRPLINNALTIKDQTDIQLIPIHDLRRLNLDMSSFNVFLDMYNTLLTQYGYTLAEAGINVNIGRRGGSKSNPKSRKSKKFQRRSKRRNNRRTYKKKSRRTRRRRY